MENLEAIVKLVDKEFGEMARNGKFRSKDDVELVYKMIDIVKDVYCVWDYENKLDGGYSEYGYYPYENNGNSYARGRNMPRNRMGQFTSREGSYRGNYSRTDATSKYLDELYEMMNNAPNEAMRSHFQKMIQEMEQQ